MANRAQRRDRAEDADDRRGESRGWTWWVIAAIMVASAIGVATWAGIGRDRRVQVSGAVRTVTDGAQDKYVEARTSARNLGLEQKVRARLQDDKTLNAEKVEVLVEDEGTVSLKGLVPSSAAKDKAAVLARDTRGVLRVMDHLAVTPPPRVIDTPATPAAPAVAERPRSVR